MCPGQFVMGSLPMGSLVAAVTNSFNTMDSDTPRCRVQACRIGSSKYKNLKLRKKEEKRRMLSLREDNIQLIACRLGNGQFGNRQFGNGQFGNRQFGNGQF